MPPPPNDIYFGGTRNHTTFIFPQFLWFGGLGPNWGYKYGWFKGGAKMAESCAHDAAILAQATVGFP